MSLLYNYREKLLYPWHKNIDELRRKVNKVLNTMTYDEDYTIDMYYMRIKHEKYITTHRCLVYIDSKKFLDTECFSYHNYNAAVYMVTHKTDEKRQFIHNQKKRFRQHYWPTWRDEDSYTSYSIRDNYPNRKCDCKSCVFCLNNNDNVCILVDTIDVVLNKNSAKYETEQKKNELIVKQQKIKEDIQYMKMSISGILGKISDAEKEYDVLQKELDDLNKI